MILSSQNNRRIKSIPDITEEYVIHINDHMNLLNSTLKTRYFKDTKINEKYFTLIKHLIRGLEIKPIMNIDKVISTQFYDINIQIDTSTFKLIHKQIRFSNTKKVKNVRQIIDEFKRYHNLDHIFKKERKLSDLYSLISNTKNREDIIRNNFGIPLKKNEHIIRGYVQKEIIDTTKEGDIIFVAKNENAKLLEHIMKCDLFISESGGLTSHASNLFRIRERLHFSCKRSHELSKSRGLY